MTRADWHRGHRLVEKRSPRGHTVYRVPEALAHLSISDIVRAVDREGWARSEISEVTGIRYQHVRNVLEQGRTAGAARGTGEDADHDEMGGVEIGRVGSHVAFADLLLQVERGGEIRFVRDGRLVAKLIPARDDRLDDPVAAACRRMDELAAEASLGGITIRELIDEGRKS
ncbi:MAG TPA: hypothetical protein PKA33_09220 [Amaricoccus sp.]|uniref:hypothetical protein n=1 Tax=Amaricoccus sp. TaxID=1872485 RepID=UPI002B5C3BC0|nr:hypothetical protein [Amaricoccus sp.]HMR30179.1 hypothetical protein [Geminicoccus sp.]HMT99530.1 hypothetical protein [Amaricoccus sp.]